MEKNKTNIPESNEVIDIHGSKVFVENGEVKTVLSEEIQRSGYMSVEELRQIIKSEVKMIYELQD